MDDFELLLKDSDQLTRVTKMEKVFEPTLGRCLNCNLEGPIADILLHANSCKTGETDGGVVVDSSATTTPVETVEDSVNEEDVSVSQEDEIEGPKAEDDNDNFYWPRAAVHVLIELQKKHQALFQNPKFTKKKVWEKIAVGMKEKGYHVTTTQISNKWKNLMAWYRKIKHASSKPPPTSSKKKWIFYNEIDALFKKKNNAGKSVSSSSPATSTPESTSSAPPTQPETPVNGEITISKAKKKKEVEEEPAWLQTLLTHMNNQEAAAQKRNHS